MEQDDPFMSDDGCETATPRAVLWDMAQEFDLLPKTLRPIHWINVEKFLGAAGFNGSPGKHRSG